MGAFADLALTLVVETGEPSRFLSLSADTAVAEGGYHETLTLMPEEE